ncbi:MAG: hypothetical protein CL608_01970 [Anaerolineaceae bacterium]|nr:hypothetical protein [Anaerolineaceae bacterium]
MMNYWQTRENDMFSVAVTAGLFAGGAALFLFRVHFLLAVLIFFIVALLVFDRTRLHHKTMVKIFHVSLVEAHQVVQNVLDEKGLPYKMYGNDRFLIDKEIEVKVSKFQTSGGLAGTAVSLIPKTHESQQLIFSLRQKLDEAFRPRGL